jgi:RNA polymerase sigma-70 factor, ECF subfamily
VLAFYDLRQALGDDPVVRLNRAVALAEIAEVQAALNDVDALRAQALADYLPFHAGAPICCAGQTAQPSLAPPTMPLSPSARGRATLAGATEAVGDTLSHSARSFRNRPTLLLYGEADPSFAIDP